MFAIGIGQESLVLKRAILDSQSRFEVLYTIEDIPNKLDFLIRNSALPSFTDFGLKIENAALFSYIIPLSKSFGYVVPEELVEFFIIFNKKLEVVKKTSFTLKFYNELNQRKEEFKDVKH